MRLLVLLCIGAVSCWGAISLETEGDCGHGTGATQTCTVTIGSSATALIVASHNGGTNAAYITGVTWNGVSLTKISCLTTSAGGQPGCMWFMSSPATGTFTLSINSAGGTGVDASYMVLDGSATAGQPEASATSQPTGGNATLFAPTVTVVTNNAWVISGGSNNASTFFETCTGSPSVCTCTTGNSETCQHVASDVNGGGIHSLGPVGTGSQAISYTVTGAGTGVKAALITLSVAPASAGSAKVTHRVITGQ